MFKGQGLAGTSNDGFDVALVTTKYLAVVSPAWKEIVKTAITSCAAVVKGLNSAAVTPPDGGKKCNPGASLFLSCIYKYNLENCPAPITFTGGSCKDDLQKLKNSDVFACLKSGA
ncbi:hypothetical protein B566_EDAN010727 [Ephemera danica]|nr:hypothetical protein B566_EDAN010727 [Ephemera danica]